MPARLVAKSNQLLKPLPKPYRSHHSPPSRQNLPLNFRQGPNRSRHNPLLNSNQKPIYGQNRNRSPTRD